MSPGIALSASQDGPRAAAPGVVPQPPVALRQERIKSAAVTSLCQASLGSVRAQHVFRLVITRLPTEGSVRPVVGRLRRALQTRPRCRCGLTFGCIQTGGTA